MKNEENFLQKEAQRAESIADYLQLTASGLLILTFLIGLVFLIQEIIGLASNYGQSTLISVLSTMLMISLIGTVADQLRKPTRKIRIRAVLVVALIGTGIGILEDWLAPTTVGKSSNIPISLAFTIMIIALITALVVVQKTERKEEK